MSVLEEKSGRLTRFRRKTSNKTEKSGGLTNFIILGTLSLRQTPEEEIPYREKGRALRINVLDKGYVRLADTFGSDLKVVNSARVSYDKYSNEFSEKDDRLLRFLMREAHYSPLRHSGITLEVYAPLLVARQWWKYAVSSSHTDDQLGWNESSRRYITEDTEFYIPRPNEWRTKPESSKQGSGPPVDENAGITWTKALERHIRESEYLYTYGMEIGLAPELVRLFLPAYSMYVRWQWTASLQSLFHFIEERLGHEAQYEIQEYARAVETIVDSQFPRTFLAFKESRNDK